MLGALVVLLMLSLAANGFFAGWMYGKRAGPPADAGAGLDSVDGSVAEQSKEQEDADARKRMGFVTPVRYDGE